MLKWKKWVEPYCVFKDDRYRYRALVAREVRITLVSLAALICLWIGPPGARALPAALLEALLSIFPR